jgi:type I restriction enzyme R subunit
MIGKYMVLNVTEKILMVMRPYQFYAAEAIVDRVEHPPEEEPNGYVWHTTGSGKTLTSFKAAQLLTALPDVFKVVFVVDRKDLDIHTIKEFNSFSKGSVDSTNDTKKLVEQFTDDTTKLIVTTLQKLNAAISKKQHLEKMAALRDERIIFIFDECHRSQFGDTHKRITAFFRNHQMFGFTGTPIFAENAAPMKGTQTQMHETPLMYLAAEDSPDYKTTGVKRTTKDLFHKKLHTYVITDAIKDENVLRFAVEYVGRYQKKPGAATEIDIEVEGIDTKELMESPKRLEKITDYIIEHHDVKTRNREFTAMMCVSSVDVLIQYYELFAAKKMAGQHNLRIATIFSYTSNEADKDADGILDDDSEIIGGDGGNPHTREKLDGFIADYNEMFGTKFSTKDTQSFYNYYQDIADKVKKRKVDILLVVNMFLTGFDSKTLNTIYVDKNLRYHGLVQAYSRTNRILNELKSQGNIVVFRNLKKRTDEAIALFSNVHAKEDIFVPPYEEYVATFNQTAMDLLALTPTVKSVKDLKDEEEELKFVKIFRELMRLRNVLESFSEFDNEDLALTSQRFENFRSAYLDLYEKVKTENTKEKASILEDVDFVLELIHRDVINVQYILTLLANLYDADEKEKTGIRKLILDKVSSDIELRTKRELIEKFIEQNLPKIDTSAEIPECFEDFWEKERAAAFERLVKEEQLDSDKLKKVIDRYVYTGEKPLPDPDIIELIQKPLSILERGAARRRVLEKVLDYVETFIKGAA